MPHLDKEEIIAACEKIFYDLSKTCDGLEAGLFFEPITGKWSIAENVQHLIISTKITTLAYTLPLFIVRWVGGKPKRAPGTYDELLLKYRKALLNGATANKTYVPKPLEIKYGKEKLLLNWAKISARFINALKYNTTEGKLDEYLARHPLLGKISLRELGYFTIFHTEHHLSTIKNRIDITIA